ncbi:uncharacterized protein LOC101863807 [Aplysia californica]|uniref:Uncharacterized protein LOC101863807 n=1 Tax=Aplysia californica TaxID=6500 RepID=A0ABM0ZY12_APLCA|nr:uncharacterized protein LOC101863807 [Aplysia californica]
MAEPEQEPPEQEQSEQDPEPEPEQEQEEQEEDNKGNIIFATGTDDAAVDTTEDFLKVFQGKTEFDSWEEFSTLFEEFQRVTGSAFKPKSATSIEYANERRVKDKIADRFVYQTVKMVCQNYGNPVKRESSLRKTKKYVGLGCEAMVHLRYKQGSLNIVSCNLEHKNHALHSGNEIIRSVRSFSFTDDVDFLIAKVVLEHNPFISWNADKQWTSIVTDLQGRDSHLKTVNIRMVKKRIRFLMDRYMANSNGKSPLPDDEMGIILFELAQARQDAVDNPPKRGGRGRKRKRPKKYEDDVLDDDDDDMDTTAEMGGDSPAYSPSPPEMNRQRRSYAAASKSSSVSSRDIVSFLNFLQRKDDQDRKMRQTELDLRREELELHKREMELQKSKFEFERVERQAHLDLLKAQLDAFAIAKPKSDLDAKTAEGITEYTIVVNNDEAFAAHAAHAVQATQ